MKIAHLSKTIALTAVICAAQTGRTQHLPDSVIQTDAAGNAVSRSYFEYDNQSRQTGATHFNLNKKTKQWYGTFRERVRYDDAGTLVERITSYWFPKEKRWQPMKWYKLTRDPANSATSTEQLEWNRNMERWIGKQRQDTKTDEEGRDVLYTDYQWYDDEQVWEPFTRISLTYAKTGEISATTTEIWRNGKWNKLNQKQSTYTEKADGSAVSVEISHEFDPNTQEEASVSRTTTNIDKWGAAVLITIEEQTPKGWITVRKDRTDISYDEAGHRLSEALYLWIRGDEWQGVNKTEATYNTLGMPLTEIRMQWSDETNDWEGISNASYEYDNKGNVLTDTRNKWVQNLKLWEPLSVMTYQYDDHNTKVAESTSSWNILTEEWDEFYNSKSECEYYPDGTLKSQKEFTLDIHTDEWKPSKSTFYY